jgi:cytochrome c peroxidase
MMEPSRAVRIAAAVVLLGALAPRVAVSQEQEPSTAQPPAQPQGEAKGGMHGAMPTAEQISLLDKLGTIPDVSKPPPGIDYVLWKEIVPADNLMTPERVALGRKLYFDTRLSKDGTVACATCHDVSRGFTDQRPVAEGIGDQLGRRNSPTTLNALFFQSFFLDGRAPSLEEQAKLPILNPIEMGQPSPDAAMQAIAADPGYQEMFQKAYGRKPSYDDVGRAIASFERTLVFLDSPFDRFLAGDNDAISEQARQGWVLYNGKARCVSCHPINPSNPIGTDNRFHNIGVAALHQDFEDLAKKALKELGGKSEKERTEAVDRLALETNLSELGHFMVTFDRADVGAFKTLQVRNVGVTGPYMHDGSLTTLWDVMDHYNKGGDANPFLDGGIEPLALTDPEIDQLVALMFSMTDDRLKADNDKLMAAQRARANTQRPFRDEALAMRRALPFEARATGTQPAPATGAAPTGATAPGVGKES